VHRRKKQKIKSAGNNMKGMDQRRQDKKSFKEESKWARKQVAAWKARGKWVGAKQTLLEYSFKVASCNVHPTTPIPCLPPDLSPRNPKQ
jgi:hypothetical protein